MNHHLITLATVFPLLLSAPAPQPKPSPPLVPAAGTWVLNWAGTNATWVLNADGSCKCSWGGDSYLGTWYWDTRERTLHVNETKDSKVWASWRVVLEPITDSRTGQEVALTGTAAFGPHQTPIKLHKARYAIPEQIKAIPKEMP